MFEKFSAKCAKIAGSSLIFCIAVLIIIVWLVSGPLFNFSSDWQLYINTGTTIVTFLMVFLIQNATNREMAAIQLKLDVLIAQLEEVDSSYVRVQEEKLDHIEKLDKEIMDA